MSERTLFLFPHSHFCEKARWALDYKGLQYSVEPLFPGIHARKMQKLGGASSVPLLKDGEEIIQGSSQIIDYLDQRYPEHPLGFQEIAQQSAVLEFEKQIDSSIGVTLRLIAYNYLLNYPDYCRTCFTGSMPGWKKVGFRLVFPLLRRLLYKVYVRSDANVECAKERVNAALDELDSRLEDQAYLFGERFSRADLSLAALMSICVLPPEHPFTWPAIPDATLCDLLAEQSGRPTYQWVQKMYGLHR